MLRSWINPSRRTSLEHHLTPSQEPLALSSAVLVSHSLRFAFLVNLPLSVRIASRAHSMVKHKFVMQKLLFSSSGVKKCFCGKTLKSWGCRKRGLRNKSGISRISLFANGLCASRVRTEPHSMLISESPRTQQELLYLPVNSTRQFICLRTIISD